jgi:hypothetical protein
VSEQGFNEILSDIRRDDSARPHHDLDVWKRSLEFVGEIYTLTEQLPDQEKFGLVS